MSDEEGRADGHASGVLQRSESRRVSHGIEMVVDQLQIIEQRQDADLFLIEARRCSGEQRTSLTELHIPFDGNSFRCFANFSIVKCIVV